MRAAETLLNDDDAYSAMAQATNPYGDGKASQRVAAAIRYHFGITDERPAPFTEGAARHPSAAVGPSDDEAIHPNTSLVSVEFATAAG